MKTSHKTFIYKVFSSVTLFALVFSLSGCATAPTFTGKTAAGEILKNDTSRQIAMSAKLYAKCDRIDSIDTKVVKVNPVGTTGDSEATRLYGNVEELWTVSLCEQKIPFKVKFTPDGKGGTYLSTVRAD